MIPRSEFEAEQARQRGLTVAEMAARGFHSAKSREDPGGWQCFAVPPDLDRREAAGILRDFAGLEPRPFGARITDHRSNPCSLT